MWLELPIERRGDDRDHLYVVLMGRFYLKDYLLLAVRTGHKVQLGRAASAGRDCVCVRACVQLPRHISNYQLPAYYSCDCGCRYGCCYGCRYDCNYVDNCG